VGNNWICRFVASSFVVMALLTTSVFAFEIIDESVVWPQVAQGHHQNSNHSCHKIFRPQIALQSGTRINGTLGEDLAFCSINNGSGLPSDSCDTATGGDRYCDVTESDMRGLKFNGGNKFQSSNGSSGGVGYCSANENIVLGNTGLNQFDSITLYSACTVTMSSTQQAYYFNKITAGKGAKLVFPAGDYWIDSLTLNQNAEIVLQGDVRLFIGSDSELNNGKINAGNSYTLQLIAYNDLTLNSGSVIGGYIYSDDTLILNNESIIKGRVTSKYLQLNSNSKINDTSSTPAVFHIQYGKATTNSITFDSPFPKGVTPLIFLMPTIADSHSNSDGPASAFIDKVSGQGFTWSQQEPPDNRYVKSNDMSEVHWIAVTPGTYNLPNNTQLIAGSVLQNKALIGSNNQYVDVALPSAQNVQLNQLQTQNNNCWLTSTAQSTNDGIELAMDASEVRDSWWWWDNERCQPGNLSNDSLQDETIAYLAVQSGSGTLVLDGNNVNYQFGNAVTVNSNSDKNLSSQCSFSTSLTGFTSTPLLVASKTSRLDNDGGWLRRCQLSNTSVSMVTDEDQYRDTDRNHAYEKYSFVAFEKKTDPLICFEDKFDRDDLGDDWVVSNSRGSFTPAIVSHRLQVTQAEPNQATSSTYQRLFSAKDNFVTIEFDHYAYDGSGADGIAFVLSDSVITPQAGAYGGPLGYGARSTVDGFAGGWLGFGIDEFGNFSTEGGPSGPGRRRQSVAVRGSGSGTTGYPYLHGSCSDGTTNTNGSCLSPTIDDNNTSPAHRYRITLDSQIANQSLVKVERDSGSGFVEIVPEFDAAAISSQADLPDNFLLSLTGSTGGSTNIHEIDNVEICALKSNPVGVQIDHFEYSYSGEGITCAPKTLSIKACANADCTQTVTELVRATLSPATVTGGGGWVGGNMVTFTDGEKSDLQLRRNTPGIVTLGVTGSTPSTKAFSETLCRINGGEASEASCKLVFADSGFIFDVPDKLANKPTGTISISAVKTSDETLQCVPLFSKAIKNVDFWSSYIDPITPINGQSLTVNSTVVGKQSRVATTLAVAFDAEGKADIIVNYPDAGKMQLDAKYTGTGDEQGLVMIGSDQFVSFPVGLCVTPSAEEIAAQCSAGGSTCTVYKKAGESFDLIIQGKAWQADGDTNFCDYINNTPNYAHNDIVLDHQLVAPAGGVLGEIGTLQYDHAAEATNRNTVSQSVTEVGVFKFTAKPPSSYLGSSFYNIPLASSPNIGRFVPDRFVVSSSSVLPSCGSFTYMDQPFGLTLTLSAFNTGTYVTKNYQGAFAKATASLVGENLNNGVDLSGRLRALPINAESWVLGEANVGLSYQANFRRTVAPSVDGPFSQLAIGVQVFDHEIPNVSFIASPDMRAGRLDLCADSNCAKQLSTQDFRHGRVVMDNTYGPENEILRMPTYAQYWDGGGWITNIDDSCTHVIDALDTNDNGTKYAPSLTAGQTVTRSDGGSSVSSGQLSLLWKNSGSAAYRGQVTAPLQVDDWLQWYWNWDSDQESSERLYEPRASAFLGRYRGHDRIIYWREVGQ
jgi:MSHA biogenesis protein MshQ